MNFKTMADKGGQGRTRADKGGQGRTRTVHCDFDTLIFFFFFLENMFTPWHRALRRSVLRTHVNLGTPICVVSANLFNWAKAANPSGQHETMEKESEIMHLLKSVVETVSNRKITSIGCIQVFPFFEFFQLLKFNSLENQSGRR
jgi:hypothetical protein